MLIGGDLTPPYFACGKRVGDVGGGDPSSVCAAPIPGFTTSPSSSVIGESPPTAIDAGSGDVTNNAMA